MNWMCKFISIIIVIISIYNQNVCGTPPTNCYQQTEGDSEIYEKLVSNCSVLCDSGTKAVQKLKCLKDDNGTSCAHVGFDLRKCFVDDESCPDLKSTNLGDWTPWSECSRSCIYSYENLPYKRRSRTCHPYCKKHIGTEEEACIDLPICKNECPRYFIGQSTEGHTLDKRTTKTEVDIMKGHVPFGDWKRQIMYLQPFQNTSQEYEAIINVTSEHVISKRIHGCGEESRKDFDFKRANLSLPIDTAFISKVIVENDIQLCDRAEKVTIAITRCRGPDFHTFRWSCNDDQQIFLHQVCDKRCDCINGADEDEHFCNEANFEITIAGVFCTIIYLITGSIIYLIIDAGTHIKEFLPPKPTGEENVTLWRKSMTARDLATNLEEEKENEEEEIMGNQLDFLFDICKHYGNIAKKVSKLKYDHMRKITDFYGKCHSDGKGGVFRFFHCLKCLSLDPTFLNACQLIVDEIYRTEIDHHHCGNNERALLCMKQHLRYDMELSDWVIRTLERRSKIPRLKAFISKVGTRITESLDCHCPGKLIVGLRAFIRLCFDTCRVGVFCLSMLKGLMLISVLMYASNQILQHHFETVDGYDMDKSIVYLIFIFVSSKLGPIVLSLSNWKSLSKYCYRRTDKTHTLIKLCSVLFPFHFAILELSRLTRLKKAHEKELQDVFNDIKKKEEARKVREKYIAVLQMMKSVKENSIAIDKLYVQAQLVRTVFERMPLCVILVSLFIACRDFHRLSSIIFPLMTHPFRTVCFVSGEFILILFFVTSVSGVVHSLRKAKNFKRFPMSTNIQGTVFQVVAILVLLIPKVFLIGKALAQSPHWYIVVMIFEFLVISLYNYSIFRSFEFFFSTATSMIIPAFYQQPSNAKTAYTTKIWKVRHFLEKYANTYHAGLLHILIALLVHTPIVAVVKSFSFFNVLATHFPFVWLTEKWNYGVMLGMYIVGFVLYVPLAVLYYHYGHNWRLLIKTKHAKNSYMDNKIIRIFLSIQQSIGMKKNNKRYSRNHNGFDNMRKNESFELGIEPSVTNDA